MVTFNEQFVATKTHTCQRQVSQPWSNGTSLLSVEIIEKSVADGRCIINCNGN